MNLSRFVIRVVAIVGVAVSLSAADFGEVTFTNAAGQAVIKARVVKLDTNGIVYSATGSYGKAKLTELNVEDRTRFEAILNNQEKFRADLAKLEKERDRPMLLADGKVLPREEFEIEVVERQRTGLIAFRTHGQPTKKNLLRQPIYKAEDLVFFRVTSSRVPEFNAGQRLKIVAADIGTYDYEKTGGNFIKVPYYAEGEPYQRPPGARPLGK